MKKLLDGVAFLGKCSQDLLPGYEEMIVDDSMAPHEILFPMEIDFLVGVMRGRNI